MIDLVVSHVSGIHETNGIASRQQRLEVNTFNLSR